MAERVRASLDGLGEMLCRDDYFPQYQETMAACCNDFHTCMDNDTCESDLTAVAEAEVSGGWDGTVDPNASAQAQSILNCALQADR